MSPTPCAPMIREIILGHENVSMRNAQMQYPGSVLGKRKREDVSITSCGDSPGTSKMSRMDSNDPSNGTLNMMTSPIKTDGVSL